MSSVSHSLSHLPVGERINELLRRVRWLPQKWQDLTFFIGEIVFLVGLLPSVFTDHKPSPWTSIGTAIMLYLFLLVHYSYKLWFTMSLTWITATLWLILFIQAI